MAETLFANQVVQGDCRDILRRIHDPCVDLVLTSPPYYHQRDYGVTKGTIGQEESVEQYVDSLETVFRECLRIVKPTGSLVFNLGDKYESGSLLLVPYRFAHRMTTSTEAKLINVITWVKPNPEPRQFKRRLVSSTEPFFHFVKSPSYKYYPEKFNSSNGYKTVKTNNQSKIGQGYFDLIRTSDLSSMQKQLALKELEQVIDEVKSGKIASFRMKIKGVHSAAYGGYEGGRKQHIESKGFTVIRMSGNPLKKDVIECPILNIRYLHHPAIYPERVVQEIINLTTKSGDMVLDPFIGSGTTAVVAKSMGRRFIGIEINPEYCSIARDRLMRTPTQNIDLWVQR